MVELLKRFYCYTEQLFNKLFRADKMKEIPRDSENKIDKDLVTAATVVQVGEILFLMIVIGGRAYSYIFSDKLYKELLSIGLKIELEENPELFTAVKSKDFKI